MSKKFFHPGNFDNIKRVNKCFNVYIIKIELARVIIGANVYLLWTNLNYVLNYWNWYACLLLVIM